MTPSRPDPGEHLDAETLAELAESLLEPPRAVEVNRHLSTCPACRETASALDRLPALLASAGDVGPMPAELVSRLATAGANERRDATATVVPLSAAKRRGPGRDNRLLQAAAAAVLLFAATAVGVSAFQHVGGDASTSADKAGAGGSEKSAPRLDGPVRVLSTGTNYTATSVAAAVPRLLAPRDESRAAAQGNSGTSSRLASGTALTGCVQALVADESAPTAPLPTPLVVDIASFHGKPATVIVLPVPEAADQLDVFVVAPDCSPADAKLLHFARVPRS